MTIGTAGALASVKLLDAEFLPILGARDDQALEVAIRHFTVNAGFDFYSMLVVHDDFSSADSLVHQSSLHNIPPEYLATWTDKKLGKVDPVLQHCKCSNAPIIYGQDTYVSTGASERWELQEQFGFACGIASAFHLPNNQHVLFGVDRRSPLPTAPGELTQLVARVQLFGTFLQCAALGVLDAQPDITHKVASDIQLSRREYECLAWAAEGKTAWETGMLLSIAEGSVAKVLAAAIRKLGCVTKPQAVVKALRLGLIS